MAYQVLAAVDASQTVRIADNPTRWHETNPVFGTHPAPEHVVGAFVLGGVVHYAISAGLAADNAPVWVRRTWETVSIGAEIACVGNNVGDGIRPTLSLQVNWPVGPTRRAR